MLNQNKLKEFLKLFGFILADILKIPFEQNLLNRKESSPYNAKFIKPGKFISSLYTGWRLTGNKSLTRKYSFRHAILFGPSGTGKTFTSIVPSLFTMDGSYVINDPSGQLYRSCAGYLYAQGYRLQVLNFGKVCDGFNPIDDAYLTEPSDINKIAESIISTSLGTDAKSAFWNQEGVSLLTFLIRIAKTRNKEYHTLAYVYRLLDMIEGDPDRFLQIVTESEQEALIEKGKALLNRDQKMRSGVIATVQAALQRFNDPRVAMATSFDSLDLTSLRFRKTALFIQSPIGDARYYAVLSALFFETLLRILLKELPEPFELDIWIIIDEAGSLFVPNLPVAIANLRKYRCGILLAVQSIAQLVSLYQKEGAETIQANCFAQLFFTAQSATVARELEQILGKYEYKDKDGIAQVRPLLSMSNIMTLDPYRAILLCLHRPMMVKLAPYYTQKRFRKYAKLKAPPVKCKLPSAEPSEELLAQTSSLQHE